MSRILFINSVCSGSTGNICNNLYKAASEEGHVCCIAYGRGDPPEGINTIKIGSQIDVFMHILKSRLSDAAGFGSKTATIRFLEQVDIFKPDIIHLHNIHGYYINIEILFDYLKQHFEIKKVWTLHDCWAFTGHCAVYIGNNCNNWKKGCAKCLYKNIYPKSLISKSKLNYEKKLSIFSNVQNMQLVTVSNWLDTQVSQSFLKNYKRKVIENGIDISVFRHLDDCKGNINKKIILGISNVWTKEKGLDVFLELSNLINEEYVIYLVGARKFSKKKLPNNIVGIDRINHVEDLVKLYNQAYVYFNPTKGETFGLTNIESQACGTATVSYIAGGTVETIKNCNAFLINNLDEFMNLLNSGKFRNIKNCNNKEKFSKSIQLTKYLNLYKI